MDDFDILAGIFLYSNTEEINFEQYIKEKQKEQRTLNKFSGFLSKIHGKIA